MLIIRVIIFKLQNNEKLKRVFFFFFFLHVYLDFLFSAGSGLDRPNLGCFHYVERVPGLAMYCLVSM